MKKEPQTLAEALESRISYHKELINKNLGAIEELTFLLESIENNEQNSTEKKEKKGKTKSASSGNPDAGNGIDKRTKEEQSDLRNATSA